MTFQVLVGIAAALWLGSVGACVLAFRWGGSAVQGRQWASVMLSAVAMAIGYLGLTRLHVVASKTVNGQILWHFDSRWFFILTLSLGTFTLAYALWKMRKAAQRA